MNGSQLTIYASQNHRVGHTAVVEWLLDQIKQCGITGATVVEASEGIDTHGKYHAARFVELADQPVAVTAVAEDDHIDALLARLREAEVRLFYTRFSIEYGVFGEES